MLTDNEAWQVKTFRFYAADDEHYDRRVSEAARDGWEPFSSQESESFSSLGDKLHVVRLKRKVT